MPLQVITTLFLTMATSNMATSETSVEAEAGKAWLDSWRKTSPVWRGLHVLLADNMAADQLSEQLPRLGRLGVNVLLVEVGYAFDFPSYPDLRTDRYVTRDRAAKLAAACRAAGLRLIPVFNCLGHQSWENNTFPLLKVYPEFDETPGQFPDNKGIYCRSWCPQHPRVNEVVFKLLDDLVDAFQADAFHAGMDEVFLVGSEHCPRCKGGNPAQLFARAVSDLHNHITGKRKREMLIWGDRLLDARALGYSEYEAAANGTHGSIDLIPKDIIICDWHYEKQKDYPSIPLLQSKGFRVWPAGWKSVEATEALIEAAARHRGEKLLGHMCTTWGAIEIAKLAEWQPLVTALRKLQPQAKGGGK